MGADLLRAAPTAAALVLWGIAAALVGVVCLVLYRRPKWARLEHDARVWRFAAVRARRWVKDHLRTVVVVIAGASVLGAASIGEGGNLARAISAALAGVAAVVGETVVVAIYHLAIGPADLHEEQLRKRRLLHAQVVAARRALSAPKATLIFDADDVRCIRHGESSELVDDRPFAGRQTLYALGVVNLSAHSLDGCRVVLHTVLGHDTTTHHLERSMRVRADTDPRGAFDLGAVGGKPSRFIEVLEEWSPPEPFGIRCRLRLTYAGTEAAKSTELEYGDHIIAFRLENEGTVLSVCYLQARYSETENRWNITQISARPLRQRAEVPGLRDVVASRSTLVET